MPLPPAVPARLAPPHSPVSRCGDRRLGPVLATAFLGEQDAGRRVGWEMGAMRFAETATALACSLRLAEDTGKVADWTFPWVCGNCTEPRYKASEN